MRYIACFFALLMISPSAFALSQPWYEGGTLQKGTVADWRGATAANQLATSADFIASISGVADISKADKTALAEIRKKAEDLQTCVNQSIQKPDVPADRPIAQVVVRCTILKPK